MQTDELIGKQIDDFLVEERIGRGGMATVYRAQQPSVHRSIALKIIKLDSALGENDEFRRRFEQEANLIASLEHIHILPIYDYGIINNELAYLAMRLLRGGSLADLLREGPLSLDRSADIFTQVAHGLAYAHSKGVVHRDLKPSNILMDEAGNAYLTDFGLAKLIENSLQLTKTGNIVGTPIYMSPEQLRGEMVDQRSDIYSLGIILYHMLVGHPPFDSSDSNMVSVIYQQLEKAPIPPSQLNADIPPAVELVALTALQKNPDNRYLSANEMADELNTALGRRLTSTGSYAAVHPESSSAARTVALPKGLTPKSQRRTSAALLGLGVLLVAILIAGLALSQNLARESRRTPATVLSGETGSSDDSIVTEDEITRARASLGAGGFIAYITCNQSSEYHATQAREMGDFAALFGLPYRVYDSDNDAYRQVTLVERARTDGASALIICPLDTQLLVNSLSAAQSAGMPLIFLHSDMPSYGGVLLAGDEYLMGLEAGRAGGTWIGRELRGEANVVILDYPDLPALVARADGLAAGVHEAAPDAHIVGRVPGGTRENGYASIRQLIAGGTDFNLILSINDAGSFGAIQALEEAGIEPSAVLISSVDAEVLAREYIAEDYFIRASIDVGREQFSRTAVNVAIKLLAGATLPEIFLVPPGEVITKDVLLGAAVETRQ
jgi:serine/threonine protein kinase/DNA-binding LacI/PurR family transcriptional regulator